MYRVESESLSVFICVKQTFTRIHENPFDRKTALRSINEQARIAKHVMPTVDDTYYILRRLDDTPDLAQRHLAE
ncbi:MAG: hypothetical protein ACOCW8_01335 [bacterium]